MQITPVTVLPPPQSASQPDTIANGLHNVQVQSAAPIMQNAVPPSPKGERGNRAKERRQEGRNASDEQGEPDGHDVKNRGENLNLSV